MHVDPLVLWLVAAETVAAAAADAAAGLTRYLPSEKALPADPVLHSCSLGCLCLCAWRAWDEGAVLWQPDCQSPA